MKESNFLVDHVTLRQVQEVVYIPIRNRFMKGRFILVDHVTLRRVIGVIFIITRSHFMKEGGFLVGHVTIKQVPKLGSPYIIKKYILVKENSLVVLVSTRQLKKEILTHTDNQCMKEENFNVVHVTIRQVIKNT